MLNRTSHVIKTIAYGIAFSVEKQFEHTYESNCIVVSVSARQESGKSHFTYLARDDLGKIAGNPVFDSKPEIVEEDWDSKELKKQLDRRYGYVRKALDERSWKKRDSGFTLGVGRGKYSEDDYSWSVEVYVTGRKSKPFIQTPQDAHPPAKEYQESTSGQMKLF